MKKAVLLLLLLWPAVSFSQVNPDKEALLADIRENIFRAGVNMDPYYPWPALRSYLQAR